MDDRTVENISDFISLIREYEDEKKTRTTETIVFRGVSSINHKLLPKIGRSTCRGKPISIQREKFILERFKMYGYSLVDQSDVEDLEWLAIGQHHGLPTRLLDWTRNPLVACYFAVEKENCDDSVVYVYNAKKRIQRNTDPFAIKEVSRYLPNHVTSRLTAQSGIFTVHPNPSFPFESPDIHRIVIPCCARRKLKKMLSICGINRASLFPDLDGLASHMQYLLTDNY
jgi:hypothetical protein